MLTEANTAKIERVATHWLICFIAFAWFLSRLLVSMDCWDARLILSEAYSFSINSCTATLFGMEGCAQTLATCIPAAPAANREFLKEDFFSINPAAKAPSNASPGAEMRKTN